MKIVYLVTSLAVVLGCAATTQAAPFDTETKLTAADAAAYDWFGRSVAISGNTALVGAVNDDDDGDASGSAYLFENVVPEPSSVLLGAMACLGVLVRRNR